MQPGFEFDQTQAARERRVKDLPTFYYHAHFVEMLAFVERHYAHVMLDEHRAFLADFRCLSRHAQCLYVRLYNRKGRVFTATGLRYPELGDAAPLLEELRAASWIGAPEAAHFDDLLGFLTRAALRDTLARRFAGLGRSMKKADLVAFARANSDAAEFVRDAVAAQAFVTRRNEAVRYLAFLYFGRVQDGLDRFTMRDLGLVRVQDFRDSYEARFGERDEALEHYFYAIRAKRLERAGRHELETLADEAGGWPEPAWAGAAAERDRLVERLGRKLERIDPGRAMAVYRAGESPVAGERYVRLLLKAGRRDEAERVLERILDAPRSEAEWLVAKDLYERKFNRKRTSTLTDTLRAGTTLELDESLSGSPERAVAAYYESQGFRAFRTENALWRTLFGLAFWTELYGAGNASLHSPFDFLPKPLADGTFDREYGAAIAARLALVADRKAFRRRLLAAATSHYGKANAVFRWRQRVLDAMFALLEAAPPASVAAMLRHFCADYRAARYGYPDLLLVRDGTARFVEVKTDGDQLRQNQLLRIEQLRAAGFDAEVVRVRWTLDPRQVYVVVDVETTGGRGEKHRVTEIGAVKVCGGEVVDRYSTLINPQRAIPPAITRLTGISAEMVADAPYFADVADAFAEFMGDAIFVAHNVEFDYGFIAREFRRLGRRFRHPKLCTCASMRKLYPGQRSYSLAALCAAFDIPLRQHHRALCDAEAAAELLLLVNERRAEALAAG